MSVVTLKQLMLDNEVDARVIEALAKPPYKIKSVAQFANFFEDRKSLRDGFIAGAEAWLKDEGDQVANLIQAWRVAEETTSRGLKRLRDGLPEAAIDEPLRDDDRRALIATFRSNWRFDLPDQWCGVDSLVARFHRECTKHKITLYRIQKISALASASAAPPSPPSACSACTASASTRATSASSPTT